MMIPFEIAVSLYRAEEGLDVIHRVEFGVVGAPDAADVLIRSDEYVNPVVWQRSAFGGLKLRRDLFDRLAIECFRGAANHMIERDSALVEWTQADATRWLRRAGFGNDLDVVLRQLRRQVQPGVSVSDNVQTMF